MQITTIHHEDVLVITVVEKRLDARCARPLRELTTGFIQSGQSKLVLNLHTVEFIDSSGLGALVSILKTIGPQGELVLCGLRASLLGLFKLTRLDSVFTIAPGETEALTKLAA